MIETPPICVLGLGYVGLPLALAFAKAGYRVIGIDIDPIKVKMIQQGLSYIEDVDSSKLNFFVEQRVFQATSNFEPIKGAQAVIICVPTPLDENHHPDLSYIQNALEAVSKHVHPGLLIVLESTTYPGTTREIVAPFFKKKGYTLGEDFFICFSPERIDPGRRDWTVYNTPKVIGGMTEQCLEKGYNLYSKALKEVVRVSSTDSAEMVKILENSFRSVNIAFINEMMIICEKLGIDIWEIIHAASSKPFGFMKFMPGPGVGGHCIPVDPLYLKWKLESLSCPAQFISLAHEVNSSMPGHWITKVQTSLENCGKTLKSSLLLLLGLAYKKNVGDMRESPALEIFRRLLLLCERVEYHDPYVPSLIIDGRTYSSTADLNRSIHQADCVLLTTDHDIYLKEEGLFDAKLIINCRGPVSQTSPALK